MKLYGPIQPDTMSDAQFEHYLLVRDYPLYWETRCWYPVLAHRHGQQFGIAVWMKQRNLVRGDQTSRNDWLHPAGDLFLFREEESAIEFRLRWGK